jgi:hypothetical protein
MSDAVIITVTICATLLILACIGCISNNKK